jgi:hypothetical protein
MRCLVCNAEMVLMEAVLADPTILPGFEHRTFSCSVCRDIERRLVFTGAKAPLRTHIARTRREAVRLRGALGAVRSRKSLAGRRPLTTVREH